MIAKLLKNLFRSDYDSLERFINLKREVIEVNNIEELKKVFGWRFEPILDNPAIYDFDYILDINQRRIRDAECLGTVAKNVNPALCLDIGTSTGHSAALMAVNAPSSQVFTVNIPPEEIIAGEGGALTTVALEREQIGSYYRQKKIANITQILANTAYWEPDIGIIDVAFVDGCHDTDFVYNDTLKILKYTKPGSFVMWHDFNLDLIEKYHWIKSVCLGVEKLYADGLLSGKMLHLRDSWVGLYQVK